MANENIRVGADMTSFDQSMEQSAKKAEQSFYDIVNSVKKSSSNVKRAARGAERDDEHARQRREPCER